MPFAMRHKPVNFSVLVQWPGASRNKITNAEFKPKKI
jgi:hypothetical protein